MDCVINVGVSILGKIGECAVALVGHQLGYLFYYKRNVANIQTQIQQLRNVRNRLQHSIDEAARNAEEIEDDVQEWLGKVRETITKAEGFIQQQGESNLGHCNFMSRYQLGRKASKMAGEMHQLKEDQVTRYSRVSHRINLQSAPKDKLYEEFESRKKTLNGIMEALRDPKFSMVIVCKPGGIGKTMLAREVARWALRKKLFSKVIPVIISQSVDVEKVQQEIAERLGLILTERNLCTRAERIQLQLEQEKEILLILDDVWVKFELADVGISFGDDQKGCKILVTSRFQDLLFDDHIDATKHLQVEFLSCNEATNLFNKIVGKSVEEPHFKVLAPKIIEECSGLPIAITTVASALRNKSLAVWDDARTQLKRSIIMDIQGMEASVYQSVKLSYDSLRSESQLVLLFCSLHEEDLSPHIDFLLKYAIGWRVFQDDYKLEETRDRVYTLTEELLARSLLLRDPNNHNCVRVHDIIRDCSQLIAANERKMHHITDARQLKCIADNGAKSLKDSVAIFLSNNHGVQLPESLECPNLKFLFLRRGRIPDQFFEKSEELRVLDMSRVKLQQLPPSICVLQSLRTLCIWDCHKLLDISFIGDLKILEVLTVAYCSIYKVPKQIGQLTRLRSLDLNECYNLKTIESDVLSKLTNLEELNLSSDRKIDWKNTGVDGESSNASLAEVKNLEQLAALYLEIDDADILPQDFFSEKLERYEILIGGAFDDDDLEGYKCDAKRMLKVCLRQRKLPKEKGLEVLLKNSQVLYLDGLENVSNFSYELDTKGFEQTKCLVLQNSNGIQHMVNSTEQTHSCSAFQSLEFLRLRSMKKLEKICHGELTPESFAKLKVIQVSSCDKLRNLFHYSIAVCLSQLETIRVRDCEKMEEIVINEGRIVGSETIFPQLRFMELKNVPKLSNYISELDPPQRSTSPLFCGKLADPTSFLKLRELFVEDSHFIKYLFSSSVAENLLQLNRLEIRNCSMLEEIIVVNQKMDKLLFPQLSFVMLDNLPKLRRFCSGAVLEFPLLTEIKMKGCPELMTFVSISEHK